MREKALNNKKNNNKKWNILLISATALVSFSILIYFIFLKPSLSSDPIDKKITIDNPYDYITEYISMPVPSMEEQDNTIQFHQIDDIDENTDNIVDNLYKEYAKADEIKDCYPLIDENGTVTFSRISEDDAKRYQLFLDYLEGTGTDLVLKLNSMPEKRNKSFDCITFLKNSDVEMVLLSHTLYSNVDVNILISKDFSKVPSVYDNNIFKELIQLLNSENASSYSGINMANTYHYQQRIWRKNNIPEEQFIYYTYFEKDNLQYFIQYKSNYTVLNGQKLYMTVKDLQSQEECRNTLISLLNKIIGT